ncbi:MAG: metallophosphoesterase [Planctomycetota bacterium]
MPNPNPSAQLAGTKLIHVSDLHCSRTVSTKYLARCIDRINLLKPDIVVLTGDYITHDITGRYRKKVTALIAKIKSRFGTYACLGNHDYAYSAVRDSWRTDFLHSLMERMNDAGVTILRNNSAALEINGRHLWLVGLGDLWVDDFNPEKAFAKIPTDQLAITLLHNPEGAMHLRAFPAHSILSGHTHGVKTRLVTQPSLRIKRRPYHAGFYNVAGKKLYVNRGLGRLGKTFFNPRPEITVFTLQ